jgi:hypothetical protein
MVTLGAVGKDAAAAVGLFGGLAGLHVYLRGTAIGDRSLIDKVTAWPESDHDGARQRDGSISLVVHNGNDHPVRIEELAYEIASTWALSPSTPAPGGGYYFETSIATQRHLVGWIGTLAPGQQWRSDHAVAECEPPEGARELCHAWGRLVRLTVVDTAGRRWRTYPAAHGRAKRLRHPHRWHAPWSLDPRHEVWPAQAPATPAISRGGEAGRDVRAEAMVPPMHARARRLPPT